MMTVTNVPRVTVVFISFRPPGGDDVFETVFDCSLFRGIDELVQGFDVDVVFDWAGLTPLA